ncbi:MAG: glycerate kinase, partial [Gemmatimonadales bacterium]
ARLVPGFDLVATVTGLAQRLAGASLVVTGEGRLDGSSWTGKVVSGVAGAAGRAGVPAWVVAGSADAPGRAGARRRGVAVLDLTSAFGAERARAEPAACIVELVSEALARALTSK